MGVRFFWMMVRCTHARTVSDRARGGQRAHTSDRERERGSERERKPYILGRYDHNRPAAREGKCPRGKRILPRVVKRGLYTEQARGLFGAISFTTRQRVVLASPVTAGNKLLLLLLLLILLLRPNLAVHTHSSFFFIGAIGTNHFSNRNQSCLEFWRWRLDSVSCTLQTRHSTPSAHPPRSLPHSLVPDSPPRPPPIPQTHHHVSSALPLRHPKHTHIVLFLSTTPPSNSCPTDYT